MIAATKRSLLLLLIAGLLSACGIAAAYRPAEVKTIRDFAGNGDYRHIVGAMALANQTIFTSDQAAVPFMQAFMANLRDAASEAQLIMPGKNDTAAFLWDPPRTASGDVDVFAMSAMAREEGINIVVSPVLANIRVKKQHSGFWIFGHDEYTLQVQAAASIYDTITCSRIDLHILTEDVDIDEQQADLIQQGQEVQVAELVEVVQEMGEALGERMGEAIDDSEWTASVITAQDGRVTISAGSDAGLRSGDRFALLDASRTLTGIDGQRYIVPGNKIGDITIDRTTPRGAIATVSSDQPVSAGSIVVPES
jgi:hypothetical protein